MIRKIVLNLFLRLYMAFERSRRNLDPNMETMILKHMREQ